MRIVVAMSGGVDSSVAALELKNQGHDVVGITIKTWSEKDCVSKGEKMCCSPDAIQCARSAAEDIGVPYFVVDLSVEFKENVKDYFVKEYTRGRTPNPCIYCNSKIKFGYLIEKAKKLGAERIATGHYARILKKGDMYYLAEGKDSSRDQSYFLFAIKRSTLSFLDFPVGEFSKDVVQEKSEKAGFMSTNRKPSQDICFATEGGGYQEYLEAINGGIFSPGDIMDKEGKVLGKHKGIVAYTIGQRHGLGLGWHEPMYVTRIDTKTNTITIGSKADVMKKKILVSGFNWLILEKLDKPREFLTRIRYNGKKVKCLVSPRSGDEAIVEFDEAQFAPTPGQAAVFYTDNIVAGGGWIEEIIA